MRVISGTLGGRQFHSTSKSTHPMSEKMRGSLFNSLGDISGLTLLDAFSGSGAISFEAVSRGADFIIAVDSNRNAQKDIENNIKLLNITNIKLIKTALANWLETSTDQFDVIICDPPYNDLHLKLIEELEFRLKDNGIFIISLPNFDKLPNFLKLKQIKLKNYGDGSLVFYKNNL